MQEYKVIVKIEVRVKAESTEEAMEKALSHVKQSDSIIKISLEEPKMVN